MRIAGSVVVVTGASSGIGRGVALALARRGARVVVAARREEPLLELVLECRRAGGQALAVPTDVTHEDEVQELARRAASERGRIDAWINNAGVYLLARFGEEDPAVYRGVIETNLFGTINGARAVLPYFRRQGSGVLVNVASVASFAPAPYLSAYASSKFAVRGFSASLRAELAPQGIHVTTVFPASIDTPIFQHAANETGRAARPLPPVHEVETAIDAIVSSLEHPRAEVIAGGVGHLLRLAHGLAPSLQARLARWTIEEHFQDRPARRTPGNVLAPMPEWTSVRGGWTGEGHVRRLALSGLAALAPLALGWFLRRRARRTPSVRSRPAVAAA